MRATGVIFLTAISITRELDDYHIANFIKESMNPTGGFLFSPSPRIIICYRCGVNPSRKGVSKRVSRYRVERQS